MIYKDGTFSTSGASKLGLISGIRSLGFVVPQTVDDEIEVYRSLSKSQEKAKGDYDAAIHKLRTVDVGKFADARDEVISTSFELFSITNGVDKVLVDTAESRLENAIYDAVSDWESAVVQRFNEVVDDSEISHLAGDLPNFSDPKSFGVLSMTKSQGQAVDKWRSAIEDLHPLWSAYGKIAAFNGYEIGPKDARYLSTNLFTACVLGDPGTFSAADSVATKLASVGAGSNAASLYGPLVPFVFPALTGYKLRLSTLADATAIRTRIQGL